MFGAGGTLAIALWAGKDTASMRTGGAAAAPSVWTEVAWPFALDEWGRGKAFHCRAADCGTDVQVYLRPKIGFCNCTSGVSDDDELDRVTDFNLIGDDVSPAGAGIPVKIGAFEGRSRAYRSGKPADDRLAFSTAYNSSCDVMVGTSIADRDNAASAQVLILEFFSSDYVLNWTKQEFGLLKSPKLN
jgi:hypothetical protein